MRIGRFIDESKSEILQVFELLDLQVNQSNNALGSFCPGDDSASLCAAGSTNSLTGQTSCPLCPKGAYSDTQGSTSCTQCPLGSISTAVGSSSCTQCNPGYESDSTNQICNKCPAGTYSNASSLSCTSCPIGSVCTAGGCSNCQLCAIGYIPNSTGTGCTACGYGTFASVGDSSCTNCSPGYYAPSQGSGSCTICPAGKYSSVSQSSSCTSCSPGQYSNAGSTSCLICPAGKFCSAGGCSVCTACSGGTILNSSATACNDCLAGTYSQNGWTVCQECTPGFYSNTRASSCSQCRGGQICNSNKCTSCSICPSGYYSSPDFTTCNKCPAGSYSSSGSSSCTYCPANTYSASLSSNCSSCSIGYYSASGDPTCHTVCGDGLRVGSEQCDDGNANSNDGCSSLCTIESGYSCIGGSKYSRDVCHIVCGDGIITSPETCDDCNGYNGDGCSSTCQTEPKYMCAFIPDCNQQVQRCILICGNGVIDNSGEQCDDGNHYNFDGCSTDCQVEKGFVCTDGSSTTVTNCLENQFMPKGSLQVLANNDLIIRFNDTITIVDPNKDDLYIVIYGPLTSYEFTWTAKFQDESTLLVNMDISSEITGKGETIYVEFLYTNRLTSIYSHRPTNPDIVLSGPLSTELNSGTSNILGQATLFIFLISVLISVLSSFGGNSMELMWIFMNYLQLIYYISAINVKFPDIIEMYFPFIQICNASNPFLSQVSYILIPESRFTRGDVSDSIGSKAFYVSASDKLPWLFLAIILFCLVKLTDFWKNCDQICCLKYIYKLIENLKYNFFLRMCIELELEIAFTATVNIFFYDISNKYEVISLFLAIFFFAILLVFIAFVTYFILSKYNELRIYARTFDRYSCLFCEIDSTKELALLWLHVYLFRRLFFSIGLILFYHSKNVQILVCISSSVLSLFYSIYSKPYKEKILNLSAIFNEICFLMLSCTVFAFSEIKFDQDNTNNTNFTDFENMFGYIFMGIFCFAIGVNMAYLIPSKIYEIFCIVRKIVKNIIRWIKYKVKIDAKISKHAHNSENIVHQQPESTFSQSTDNQCVVEIVPKWDHKFLERERKNLEEDQKINHFHREFSKKYEIHEEGKNMRLKRRNETPRFHQNEMPTFDLDRIQRADIHWIGDSSVID